MTNTDTNTDTKEVALAKELYTSWCRMTNNMYEWDTSPELLRSTWIEVAQTAIEILNTEA